MTGEDRKKLVGWTRKKYPTMCDKYSVKISIFIENIPGEMTLKEAKGQIEKELISINQEAKK
ncbi:MAG: hypothetical protein PHQ46_11335 [Negativicutes bacterium]|nr:hypothetical protein [Negativicutes bacterium]